MEKKQIDKLKKKLKITIKDIVYGKLIWSNAIRNDFVSCKICGEPAEETHHIFYVEFCPELMFNWNNGIPLCKKHHNETHGFKIKLEWYK